MKRAAVIVGAILLAACATIEATNDWLAVEVCVSAEHER